MENFSTKKRLMANAGFMTCSRAAMVLACVAVTSPAIAQTVDSLYGSQAATTDSDNLLLPTDTNATTTTQSQATGATSATTATAQSDDLPLLEEIGNKRATAASRLNTRTTAVDGTRTSSIPEETAPGIRVGTFTFNPSLRQSLGYETNRSGGTSSSRSYLETELKGALTSNWSRHQLKVNGSGTFQKNLTGTGSADPAWSIDAELRLDATRDTTLTLTGAYNFAHESATDPNSVSGASTQSGVHKLSGGIKAEQRFGRLKGSLSATVARSIYGPATFANGTVLYQGDHNANTAGLALRLGYEIAPAFAPFVEGSVSRTSYDLGTDSSGYARNSRSWGLRAGFESDLGEKMKGEVSAGYKKTDFQDSRLASIAALTADASLTWSPLEGTDVNLGLSTDVNPSTSAGTSGYVSRAFTASLSQQVTRRLVARLTGGLTDNRYPASSASSNMMSWTAGAGFTWRASRYLDVTGNLNWQYDKYASGSDYQSTSFIAGVEIKR